MEEHIYFYARLKGCSRQQVQMEADRMIQDVGLPHKRKDLAKNLSGASTSSNVAAALLVCVRWFMPACGVPACHLL